MVARQVLLDPANLNSIPEQTLGMAVALIFAMDIQNKQDVAFFCFCMYYS